MSVMALSQVLAMFVAGPVAQQAGIRNLYFGSAAMLAIIGVVGYRNSRRRSRRERHRQRLRDPSGERGEGTGGTVHAGQNGPWDKVVCPLFPFVMGGHLEGGARELVFSVARRHHEAKLSGSQVEVRPASGCALGPASQPVPTDGAQFGAVGQRTTTGGRRLSAFLDEREIGYLIAPFALQVTLDGDCPGQFDIGSQVLHFKRAWPGKVTNQHGDLLGRGLGSVLDRRTRA